MQSNLVAPMVVGKNPVEAAAITTRHNMTSKKAKQTNKRTNELALAKQPTELLMTSLNQVKAGSGSWSWSSKTLLR